MRMRQGLIIHWKDPNAGRPMYRIVEWDERYEIDTKGRDWTPGAPKWKGPLRFIKLKANGRLLGVGFRRLIKVAGRAKALQVFGLFCKLLEIAGNADRDDRNQIETDKELAFTLQMPVKQVEQSINVLLEINWIEKRSEPSETFRTFGPTEPNRTEPNRTQQNDNQTQPNNWEFLRRKIESDFGRDRGIEKLLAWLATKLLTESNATINATCERLEILMDEARGKDSPAAWFMTSAGRSVGYPGTKRT